MADQELTYEQVVIAAEKIVKNNERVTIERVRRLIGYGDMIKIVNHLRRWQKEKNLTQAQDKKSHAETPRTQAKQSSDEVVVVVNNTNANNHKSRHRRNQAFSFERLQKESVAVQALFWALYQIRQQKNCAIEQYQLEKNSMNEMMMDVEDKIRAIKRSAKEEITKLMQQHYKISLNFQSERKKLR
ncbi:DNA-binding protein [Thiotrichales bacterium 19S3-7]|nr:DNA-binding protein [Thiotrichales bacterium 19S3-7]MCF6800580.1 DNA-binding protein [Thiotrichales bacterium 19S3-11]